MKNYTITVNGTAYEVSVEESTGSTVQAAAPKASVAAPSAPVAAPKAAAPVAAPKTSNVQGGVKINAPMPGKIISIKANVGQAIKKGEVVLILEAMKMENEIVAPEAGTVASINVSAGDMVEAGILLASLN